MPAIVQDARNRLYEYHYQKYIRERVQSRRAEFAGLRGLPYLIHWWRIELWAWKGARHAAAARC